MICNRGECKRCVFRVRAEGDNVPHHCFALQFNTLGDRCKFYKSPQDELKELIYCYNKSTRYCYQTFDDYMDALDTALDSKFFKQFKGMI